MECIVNEVWNRDFAVQLACKMKHDHYAALYGRRKIFPHDKSRKVFYN